MSRITLAFSCFFRLLFSGRLPARAVEYLPEEERPAALLPEVGAPPAPGAQPAAAAEPAAAPPPAARPAEERRPARSTDLSAHHRDGALALLALLQREGRFVDFLRESLDDYSDADIGAAVRDVHRGCRNVLGQHFTLEPVMPGQEDDRVNVPRGFDPTEIRLVGEVSGEPPFRGVLRHHGWRVTALNLPTLSEGVDRHVVAPAEVEISQ
jgi:hypothetical protein